MYIISFVLEKVHIQNMILSVSAILDCVSFNLQNHYCVQDHTKFNSNRILFNLRSFVVFTLTIFMMGGGLKCPFYFYL